MQKSQKSQKTQKSQKLDKMEKIAIENNKTSRAVSCVLACMLGLTTVVLGSPESAFSEGFEAIKTTEVATVDSGSVADNASGASIANSTNNQTKFEKTQVVYAKINSTGSKKGVYVVNNFESSSLNSGTQQLQSQTANVDTKMVSTVKDKLQEYLNPTFTLADFVNGDTQNIKRVQFVYMTDSIEIDDENAHESNSDSDDGSSESVDNTDNGNDANFFSKLIALFAGE